MGTLILSLEGAPSSSGSAIVEDDPELAEAIRASQADAGISPAQPQNEQDAIQQAILLSQQQEEEALQQAILLSTQQTVPPATPATPTTEPIAAPLSDDTEDPDALLDMAIMMSQEAPPAAANPSTTPPSSSPATLAPSTIIPSATTLEDDGFGDDGVSDIEAELMAAIQMSLGTDSTPTSTSSQSTSSSAPPSSTPAPSATLADDLASESFSDPSLRDVLNSVLDEIEGIDKNDPDIIRELNRLTGEDKDKKEDAKK